MSMSRLRRGVTVPSDLGSTRQKRSDSLSDLTASNIAEMYRSLVGDCIKCAVSWCQEHSGYSVKSFEDADWFVRTNKHIRNGYRPMMPKHLCVRSIFTWNNETLNIWTHLLGFLMFFGLCIYDNNVTLPAVPGTIYIDHVVHTACSIGAMVCMLNSALFHVLHCMSAKAYNFWLQVDLLGVVFAMTGCYLPGLYYPFYCHHDLHNMYLSIYFLLIGAVIGCMFHPGYMHPQRYVIRAVMYSAIAFYGIVPASHYVKLHGFNHEGAMFFFRSVLTLYAIFGVAAAIYLAQFPERYFPGRLDHVGQSHQIWHILVISALLYWRAAAIRLMTLKDKCSS